MITLLHGVLSVMCYRCSYDYIAAWCLICDELCYRCSYDYIDAWCLICDVLQV